MAFQPYCAALLSRHHQQPHRSHYLFYNGRMIPEDNVTVDARLDKLVQASYNYFDGLLSRHTFKGVYCKEQAL